MNLIEIGLLTLVGSAALLGFTGNIFPDSKRHYKQHQDLFARKNSLSETQRQQLAYFKFNHIIRRIGIAGRIAGLIVIVIGIGNS